MLMGTHVNFGQILLLGGGTCAGSQQAYHTRDIAADSHLHRTAFGLSYFRSVDLAGSMSTPRTRTLSRSRSRSRTRCHPLSLALAPAHSHAPAPAPAHARTHAFFFF